MKPLAPGATIGILGGGQLGRMIASAGARLGFDILIYEPEHDSPASRVAAGVFNGAWEDDGLLTQFAQACDVVTLEFENVPVRAAETITAAGCRIAPGPYSLSISQDRLAEKTFLNTHAIPTTPFHRIDTPDDLDRALSALGGKGLLKTRREGYDGKGQAWLDGSVTSAVETWKAMGAVPCILEAKADFACEISVIVARSLTGEAASWDPPRNEHSQGILSRSVIPAGLAGPVEAEAREKAIRLAALLDHVGVLTLEFFVLADGTLLANEFAPRVHNSGHWTQEACHTGQFEQHIRCIAGWPLGSTERFFDAEMINLIGDAGRIDPASLMPSDCLTLYGKRTPRPGRKMGHITRILSPRKD